MDYGSLCRTLREKLAMTQTEFGEKLGVSLSAVNRWELGKNSPNPTVKKKIIELCKENDVEIKYFLYIRKK